MTDIYGSIRGEILITELGDKRLYLYDRMGMENVKFIFPNLLAIKHLRDYCDEIIKKNPEYFKKD